MARPVSSERTASWERLQLSFFSSLSCSALACFSRSLAASCWRLRNAASCSAGVSGPFFASLASSLASLASSLLSEDSARGGGADLWRIGAALTPAGGVALFFTPPLLSVHFDFRQALPATRSPAANTRDRIMVRRHYRLSPGGSNKGSTDPRV